MLGLARFMPLVVVVAASAWSARVCAAITAKGALFGDMFPLLAAHVHALSSSLSARDADAWIHGANLGYPAGTFAPLLPSLLPASLHAVGVDVHTSIHIALALPLVLLPLSTYAGLRLASVAPWPAAIAAALVAFVLGSRFGLGIESAFGGALLDEAWAALFLPLAAGAGARFIAGAAPTRTLAGAIAASTACALCHPVIGASAAMAWVVALFSEPTQRRARVVRGALLVALCIVGTLPMTLPALATWSAHGVFGPHLDDGDGGFAPAAFIAFVLHALDGERAPVLTLLALAGILATAVRVVRAPADTDSADDARATGTPFVVIAFFACVVLLLGPYLAWGQVPWGRFTVLLQLALCALAGIGAVDVVMLCTRAVPLGGSGALAIVVRIALVLSIAAIVVIAAHGQNVRIAAFRAQSDEPGLARDLRELDVIARASSPAARLAAIGPLRTISRHALADEGDSVWPGLWSSIGPSVASSPNAALWSRNDVVDTVQVTNTGLILVASDAPQSARPPQRDFVRAGRFHVYETRQRNWFAAILLDAPTDNTSFDDQARAWWDARGYRTGRHLVDDHKPSPAGKGKVTILEEEVGPSRFTASLDVATDGPRAVMLKVSWHPWWRASIDGKPVRALRISPAMLAAEVPPGPHTLTFEFVRPWWTLLLWLAPIALVVGTLRGTRRRR